MFYEKSSGISLLREDIQQDEIIKELQLVYYKARQAIITREIAVIVAGAAAIE